MPDVHKTAVAIVGGGLSGLFTAFEMHKRGMGFLLLEARERLGGRILSPTLPKNGAGFDRAGFDLGPAWFWPGQHRMAALIRELELEDSVFSQHAEGQAVLEKEQGQVYRGDFGASMAGAYRLRNGLATLIRALADRLPESRILLGRPVIRLRLGDGQVRLKTASGLEIEARRVVLALPPRSALARIDWIPELNPHRRRELGAIQTWMAGQGKFMAVYDTPFWRRDGLSGDAFSSLGPLGEIHDASPPEAGPYALFGFFAVPPAARNVPRDRLVQACLRQLTRLFGPQAADPLEARVQDWALEAYTATEQDLEGQGLHSLVGLSNPLEEDWRGRLIWSGAETAAPGERNNGYLEGALEAGERSVDLVSRA